MLTLLDENHIEFPPIDQALSQPNGLLAIGGALSRDWLEKAYSMGVFPWFNEGEPILWWCPFPRAIVETARFQPSRSLQKLMRNGPYKITVNCAFDEVIESCAQVRAEGEGTWINRDMIHAYQNLARLGRALSVEVWQKNRLVGGLYGVVSGQLFCGESMFHHQSNCSKLAFWGLCNHLQRYGITHIDCQLITPHLLSLGAQSYPKEQYTPLLAKCQLAASEALTWPHFYPSLN